MFVLISCSTEDMLVDIETVQEAAIFDVSASFSFFQINIPQDANNRSADFEEFDVTVSDSIVDFIFRLNGPTSYYLIMQMHRDFIPL